MESQKPSITRPLACFDKILAMEPDNKDVWKGKGASLKILGKYEEAVACFDKALAIDPEDKDIKAWKYTIDSKEKA